MLLLFRDRKERKGKPQSELEKGPASSKLERLTAVTRGRVGDSHLTPNQLHGFSSTSFQEERD